MKKLFVGIWNVVRSFFCTSDGLFQPVYFWATVFCALIATTWVLRLVAKAQDKIDISDPLLLGLCGFVVVWLAVYNWFKYKNAQGQPIAPTPDDIHDDHRGMSRAAVPDAATMEKMKNVLDAAKSVGETAKDISGTLMEKLEGSVKK